MYTMQPSAVMRRLILLRLTRRFVALASTHVPCIDAFEQHRELARVNLHAGATIVLANALESALLQALVTHDEMLALRSLRHSLCS